MRYFDIEIQNASGATVKKWTSLLPNGNPDPAAQTVEFDLPVVAQHTPMGSAFVRVWGVSLQDIQSAGMLNGMAITVMGGMSKGLPLADPTQAGVLVSGMIFQAFGNWQGIAMSLDLYIRSGFGTPDEPKNIIVNWMSGQPMFGALKQALLTAFPGYTVTGSISSNLVQAEDEQSAYPSVDTLADWAVRASQAIIQDDTYRGVFITSYQKTFVIYDGTSQSTPKQIKFTDMIGQCTWSDPETIQATVVMRGDLRVSDYIKLPPGQVSVSSQSLSQYRQGSVFQGVFQIDRLHHVGNSREPNGEAWVTTMDCHPVIAAAA